MLKSPLTSVLNVVPMFAHDWYLYFLLSWLGWITTTQRNPRLLDSMRVVQNIMCLLLHPAIVSYGVQGKVHVFQEGHKNDEIFTADLTFTK